MKTLRETLDKVKTEALDKRSYDMLADLVATTDKQNVEQLVATFGNMVASKHSDLIDTVGERGFTQIFQTGYSKMAKAMKQAQQRI